MIAPLVLKSYQKAPSFHGHLEVFLALIRLLWSRLPLVLFPALQSDNPDMSACRPRHRPNRPEEALFLFLRIFYLQESPGPTPLPSGRLERPLLLAFLFLPMSLCIDRKD